MRSVQVYVEGMRLELFQDENITVNSSQQNINDIASVMTDYSQTFNIPASNNNNRIFEHFYESAIDGSLDHNIRRDATIEIDLATFRKGKISIEKASLKNGQADSYAVTFYGETLALKDKMGEELLKDLEELSSSSFSYTPNNVLAEVQDDTFGAVKFPLITNRILSYEDGTSTDISHTGTNAIVTDELFPAVSIKTIFDAIETRYDLQFNGTFLDDDRFKKAYLYCKNAKDFEFITKNTSFNVGNRVALGTNYNSNLQVGTYLELPNKVKVFYQPLEEMFPNLPNSSGGNPIAFTTGYHRVAVEVSNLSDSNTKYYVDVLENGLVVRTIEGIGNTLNEITTLSSTAYNFSNQSLNTTFTFRARSTDASLTFDMDLIYNQVLEVVYDPTGYQQYFNQFLATQSMTFVEELDVSQYMPKMKVTDFFKGILNMFNLTCYGLGKENDVDIYQVEPLDDWYQKGAIIDITPHVDIEDIEVSKVPLYKNISFDYKPSKSVTNEQFTKLFGRSYGSTKSGFEYDGGEYKICLLYTSPSPRD